MNARTLEPIHVLVADDEAPARQRLVDLLRRDEQIASISEAADGETAVEMIENENPDLLFLDVQMPKLDGFAFRVPVPVGGQTIGVTSTC